MNKVEFLKYFSESTTIEDIVCANDRELMAKAGFGRKHMDEIHSLRTAVAKQAVRGCWYMDVDEPAINRLVQVPRRRR